jgi:hypothetical protein
MLFIYEDGTVERVVEIEEWFNVSWIISPPLIPPPRREINIFAFPLRRGK